MQTNNPPPQLNDHGGFGGEVGPTHETLSPKPDQVINNLSAQLDNALKALADKRAELDNLKMELRARLKDEPLTFLKIDLLNLIDPPTHVHKPITTKPCKDCDGTGTDTKHKWPSGDFASCETCEGTGSIVVE